MSNLQKEIIAEHVLENRLCKMVELEMQCYCEHKKHLFDDKMGKDFRQCANTIPYKHHHDWGREEDYMCEDCLNNCEEN